MSNTWTEIAEEHRIAAQKLGPASLEKTGYGQPGQATRKHLWQALLADMCFTPLDFDRLPPEGSINKSLRENGS